ncbi:MAG: Hpt domain-containing protein [Rugosibacter sp.]|nr:Hpt domain-containing protein [Rugosibacter sp.]
MAIDLDIGPLSWVKGEIDLSLGRVASELAAYTGKPDNAILKQARASLHQAHGALVVVGLEGVVEFSQAIETALATLDEASVSERAALIHAIEDGLGALRAYLDDLMAGGAHQPLKLFPAYRSLILERGLPAPGPAEFFFPDLTQRPPKRERELTPMLPEALLARLKAARLGFERGLVKWIKGDVKGVSEMKTSLTMIETTRQAPGARALWWVALGVLDALGAEGLPDADEAKRFLLHLAARIKKLIEGTEVTSDALLREALYLAAVATQGHAALAVVRAAYRLDGSIPDLMPSPSQGREPHIRRLRELLAAAKEDWNRLSAGTVAALPPFHERVIKIGEEAAAADQPSYQRLIDAIRQQADLLRRDPTRHSDILALEMATALLLAETALDNFATLGKDFTELVDIVAGRLDALTRGDTLAVLELPRLDAMSRRAQERLLMESVVREIRTNLGVIEQTLDAFFRDPSRKPTLPALQQPIRQVEGALAVLGEDRAASLLAECGAAIQRFTEPGHAPQPGEFEAVADKLAAIGFFVAKLQLGTADIDAILAPPTPSHALEMVAEPEVAASPASPEGAGQYAESGLELPAEPTPDVLAPPEAPPPSAEATRLVEASTDELDAELLGIFIEEAHEVLATIDEHLPQAHGAPHDQAILAVLRRSFHTLKGSGRMVGLAELGEVAWDVEQVLNRWLDEARDGTAGLLAMLDLAADVFRTWVQQLEQGSGSHLEAGELSRRCEALRDETVAAEPAVPPAPAFVEPPVLKSAEPTATVGVAAAQAGVPVVSAEVFDFPEPAPVRVGEVEVAPALYGMYLEEARGHVAVLQAQLGHEDVPGDEVIRAAHTTASISAATGFLPIHHLAHALEAALLRFAQLEIVPDDDQRFVFARCAGALEGMLGAIAERRMPSEEAKLAGALAAMSPAPVPAVAPIEVAPEMPIETPEATPAGVQEETASATVQETPYEVPAEILAETAAEALPETAVSEIERRALRIEDEIDAQLLPLFLDESVELMNSIGELLRAWRDAPEKSDSLQALTRALHTLKGSARMAGAMACGELLHAMETRIEDVVAGRQGASTMIDSLEASYDRAAGLIEHLRYPQAETVTTAVATAPPAPLAGAAAIRLAGPADHGRVSDATQAQLRVRAAQVDQWVNEAGEIAIARARIEGEMREIKASLLDLTENVLRLRSQLREVDIQAESQMQSRQALAIEKGQVFDPLEFDRFTRFQEVTRMMAESVSDVDTVQHNLLLNLDHANAALAAQARLNRDLSQRLMSARMVPFDSLAERLYRVVRQAAKEVGKRVNLDIHHGQLEMDRSVLEKMAGPLEHLLRNSVAHGIEEAPRRRAAGKPAIGQITLSLAQEGNEIVISITDDGAGLDFSKIRQRAVERGLLPRDMASAATEAALTQLIFQSGLSTADEVTALAGRGVGMDVVKNETTALGGRIDILSAPEAGTTFRLTLPLTLAVIQALLVQVGHRQFAIPSAMVEQASELKADAIALIRATGGMDWRGMHYPWQYLPQLLGNSAPPPPPARRTWLLNVRGGTGVVALEVDGLSGNQEVVVKPIGSQLARVPGLIGATVLADGEIVFIVNPVALLAHAAERSLTSMTVLPAAVPAEAAAATLATVMVVDDSLTVRKITGRLLTRQGYRVLAAKDGVDALEQLADEMPDVMLVDIEMPRMDGFDLTRHVRADERLRYIPIIMITSRTAEKHRSHAMELGVNHYLGKPYDEDELLARIAESIKHKQGKI